MITLELADILYITVPFIIGLGYMVYHHIKADDEQHKHIIRLVEEIKDVLEKEKD